MREARQPSCLTSSQPSPAVATITRLGWLSFSLLTSSCRLVAQYRRQNTPAMVKLPPSILAGLQAVTRQNTNTQDRK